MSAVGHEIDFSIADFVADLRAPTPSAAAEVLTPDCSELLAVLGRRRSQLENCARRHREVRAQRLDQLQQRLQAQRPQARLQRGGERLRDLTARLQRHPRELLLRLQHRHATNAVRLARLHPRQRVVALATRLAQARSRQQLLTVRGVENRTLQLAALGRALNAVSPLATLGRGYALLLDPSTGRVLRRVADIAPDAQVDARLVDGTVRLKRES